MSQDNSDLENLFESVSAASKEGSPEGGDEADGEGNPANQMFNKLGGIVRQFHTALHELGLDQQLRTAAGVLPEASDHLAYVVRMTEEAANKTLTAHERASPVQEALHRDALGFESRWNRLMSDGMNEEEFKKLACDTHMYFTKLPAETKIIGDCLQDILMSQDFQDLCGQVIKRLIDLNKALEGQLLHLLVESADKDLFDQSSLQLVNGPAVNTQGKSDFVTDQEQVDDLLESLGF
jgi:chemotaxis protein CheZ